MTTVLRIGHRGAPSIASENTLESFDAAIDAGCNAIELDVRPCLKRDNACSPFEHLVVIHDGKLDRTTNKKGKVRKLTLPELKTANAGNGQQICSLQEVLEHLRDKLDVLFIELKKSNIAREIGQLMQQEIAAGNWKKEQLVAISFLPGAVRAVREVDESLHIGCSLYDTIRSFRFNNAKEHSSLSRIAQLYNPQYFTPCIDDLTETMVEFAKAHNIQTATWTANTEDAVRYATHCGVEGIMSDYPELLA